MVAILLQRIGSHFGDVPIYRTAQWSGDRRRVAQRQLVGNFKRLAECQYDGGGEVLIIRKGYF